MAVRLTKTQTQLEEPEVWTVLFGGHSWMKLEMSLGRELDLVSKLKYILTFDFVAISEVLPIRKSVRNSWFIREKLL